MTTKQTLEDRCPACGEHMGLRLVGDPKSAQCVESRRNVARPGRMFDCWAFHVPCRDTLRASGRLEAFMDDTPPSYTHTEPRA